MRPMGRKSILSCHDPRAEGQRKKMSKTRGSPRETCSDENLFLAKADADDTKINGQGRREAALG